MVLAGNLSAQTTPDATPAVKRATAKKPLSRRFRQSAAATMPTAAATQEEAFTGKIFTASGVVEHQKAGAAADAWTMVIAPYDIEAGDKVRTGPGSTAEIYVKYGAKVRLSSSSTFVLDMVSKEENSMSVLMGKMQAWIRKAAKHKLTVRTPSAVCAIRGTVFEVEVAETGETVWSLFSGSLLVSDNNNNSIDVAPNQRVVVTKEDGVSKPEPLPAEVNAPVEPKKINEEKEEIKLEKQEAKVLEKDKNKAEEAKEEASVVVVPETAVIETQTVQESCEVSGSTPGCNE